MKVLQIRKMFLSEESNPNTYSILYRNPDPDFFLQNRSGEGTEGREASFYRIKGIKNIK